MAAPSPPIDIASSSRYSSSSPRNNASNLTSALQQAGNASPAPTNIDSTKPRLGDIRPPSTKQDSLGYGLGSSLAESRPISVGKGRRESAANGAGSFMGGMSWGGMSMSSLLADDIMMGGTSPYNVGSPSFHSSSYLPKMEANFWNNLRCCNTNFIDLHELLQHFEQIHSQEPSTFPYRMSLPGTGKIPRRKNSTIDVAPDRPSNQVRGFQPQSNANAQPHPLREGRVPGQNEQNNMPLTSHVHDMDTMGDMEMDDENPIHDSQNMNPSSNSRPTSINPSLANMLQNQAGFPSSNPTTPRASQALQRTNPMVSSVNTPTLTHNSSAFSTDTGLLDGTLDQDPFSSTQFPNNDMLLSSHMLQNLQTDFGSLDFNDNMNMNGNGMLDLCINDPAKALFSENGGINSTQYPQFGFINGAATNTDNPSAHKLTTPNLASGIPRGQLPGEEDRPFKCPVIGCEKAYKNANGLRYHEKHGHSSQKLKDNSDGTYSIVDPVTSIPYPGTVGMEKEKPYRCEHCGKRYKNLNGLKYHRNHSPPCNPDFSFNNVTLPDMGAGLRTQSAVQGDMIGEGPLGGLGPDGWGVA